MIEFIKHKKYEEKTFAEIDIFEFFIGRKKGDNNDLICMKIPQINMKGSLSTQCYVDEYTKNAIKIDFLSSFCDKDRETYTPQGAGSNMRYLGFDGNEVVRPLKSEIKIHHKGSDFK